MTPIAKWSLAAITVGVMGAGLYLVIANPEPNRPSSNATPTTGTPTSADSTPPTSSATPLLTEIPMDDTDRAVTSLAPVTKNGDAALDAAAAATTYFDTLVDPNLDPTQWQTELKELTTAKQFSFAIDGLDGSWYDGLGTRTDPIRIEETDAPGIVYAHITTTVNEDIIVVLVRPTEGDTWRVDGYKQ